ncbi:hypothetical protein KUCAC02_004346 [Chaenocephalus aceratus]|uniref:Uncharacterized protein n=1 Tax=Chaenocephalus aceratus TaxID=36190 RepID=A0ACB9WYA3_CHAAC|nr:hypothetical protein KUCAC02_004346 [Chaenocephalus aceratus]
MEAITGLDSHLCRQSCPAGSQQSLRRMGIIQDRGTVIRRSLEDQISALGEGINGVIHQQAPLKHLDKPAEAPVAMVTAAGISAASLLRMCRLENMRALQGPQGSTACDEETVKNVNLDIASTSTRRAKNVAIV